MDETMFMVGSNRLLKQGDKMEFDKDTLIQRLLFLIRKTSPLHCFGSRGYGNMETGEMKMSCDCAGNDDAKHSMNQRNLFKLEKRMCEIIEEDTGIPVFIFPGTYGDYHFCKSEGRTRTSAETFLVLNHSGEIKEMRSYI